jgi:hypothetical protein
MPHSSVELPALLATTSCFYLPEKKYTKSPRYPWALVSAVSRLFENLKCICCARRLEGALRQLNLPISLLLAHTVRGPALDYMTKPCHRPHEIYMMLI